MNVPTEIVEFSENFNKLANDSTIRLGFEFVVHELEKVSSLIPDCEVIFHQESFLSSPGESERQVMFLLHPSFRVVNGQIQRFKDQEELLRASRKRSRFATKGKNITIQTRSEVSPDQAEILQYISIGLSEIYGKAVYPHLEASSARKFTRSILAHPGGPSFKNLAVELQSQFQDSVKLWLARNRSEKQSYVLEWVPACDPNESWKLPPSKVAECIFRALAWGRTTDGFLANFNEGSLFFTVVPTPDSFGGEVASERGSAAIVIGSVDQCLDSRALRYLEVAASSVGRDLISNEEKSIVKDLQNLRRDLISRTRVGSLRTEQDRQSFIAGSLPSLVERLRRLAGAHSLTLRTYNPFDESLVILAESSTPSGARGPGLPTEINISEANSVNVSCFKNLTAGEFEFIDFEDGVNGKNLLNPRQSTWEACFSIWKSGVPYGTMNIEGNNRRIIDGVLDFFSSVALHFSELFSQAATLLPSEAITQISTVAYSVHGTLDAEPWEFDFIKEGRPIEEIKIIEGWQKYIKKFRSPINRNRDSADRVGLEGFVKEKLFDLFGQWNREQFSKTVTMFFAEDLYASPAEAANLQNILELLVANAVKHSGLGSGTFQIYGLIRGRRPFLFIRYRTSDRSVEASVLREFGSVPIVKDGKVRYGAFLLGEMVRSANGLLYVNQDSREVSGLHNLHLVVALPLSMEVVENEG